MKKNRIFLSYRRDDSPGYVSRLENELERVFGDGRVFRDATDIPGGTKWKNVIDANLHSSAVLLLVIGPRWEQIWHERINEDVNYVALELERARELDVPIIPVTLDGTELSRGLDLGSINFIFENQFHDISDRQGRWRGDFERLVSLLNSVPGIGSASNVSAESLQSETDGGSRFNWWVAVAGVLVVAVVWLGMHVGIDEPGVDRTIGLQDNTVSTPAINVTSDSQQNLNAVQSTPPVVVTEPGSSLPDINGTWQGRDGTVYVIQQRDDATFSIQSPSHGAGEGRFLTKMPRKFEVEMFGVGRGEFSVSFGDDKAMGWLMVDDRQEFDTLLRVE